MGWLSLRVDVERARADVLSDALMEAGAQSVALESLDGPRTVLSALFAEGTQPERLLEAAAAASGVRIEEAPSVGRVADEDWVRRSQAQFSPVGIGRLWVGATWHEAPSEASAVVRIDPGLAFGTGSHPTTRLVLAFLEGTVRGGERVLDYGCGSGILAIAAAKLGAGSIDAVDVDPQALAVTEANARANQVALRASLPDALEPGGYDLVVANILAQPLIDLAPQLAPCMRPGGRIALAGILDSQAEEVCAAYGGRCAMSIGARDESWVLVHGVHR